MYTNTTINLTHVIIAVVHVSVMNLHNNHVINVRISKTCRLSELAASFRMRIQ